MLYPTVLPNPQISALSVTNLVQKNCPNFSLWAHFVRRYFKHAVSSEVVTGALFLCNSTANWKNSSPLGARIMENRYYRLVGSLYAEFSPLFPTASFWRFLDHAVSPEADSAALRCIPTYYQTNNYQLSRSPYRRELTTNFLQKNSLNFSFWGTQNWG